MDKEPGDLQGENLQLRQLIGSLFDGLMQAHGMFWIFSYLLAVFILWWGFSQGQVVLVMALTWGFEFANSKFHQFLENQKKKLCKIE